MRFGKAIHLWMVILMCESPIVIHSQGESSKPSTSVPEPGSDSGFSKGVHEFSTVKECAENCKSGTVQAQDYVECVPKAHVYENYPGFDLVCKCRLYFEINRKNCRPIDQPHGGESPEATDQGEDPNTNSKETTTKQMGEDGTSAASSADPDFCRQTFLAVLVLGSFLGTRLDQAFMTTFIFI